MGVVMVAEAYVIVHLWREVKRKGKVIGSIQKDHINAIQNIYNRMLKLKEEIKNGTKNERKRYEIHCSKCINALDDILNGN